MPAARPCNLFQPAQGWSQQTCHSAPSVAEPAMNLLSLPARASCKLSDAWWAFGKLNNASVLFSEAEALCRSSVQPWLKSLWYNASFQFALGNTSRHRSWTDLCSELYFLRNRQNMRRGGRSGQQPRWGAFQFNTLGPYWRSWGENAWSMQKSSSSELNHSSEY